MIQVTKLKKQYDNTIVLQSLDMHVKKGSIYGLIGVNGAGKSTLLNVLGGIFKPDGGEVRIDGEEVYENPRVKEKIAYVTDDPYFFTGATVVEMASFLDRMYKSFSITKFYDIIKHFPIDAHGKLSGFSKGMKRQAAIVLALAQNPDILLCDECFDGLDPAVRMIVKQLFITEACERGMTVVISSHNLGEMENLCDTIGIMHSNSIIVEKSVDEMKENVHRYSAAYKPMIGPDEIKARIDVVSLSKKNSIMEIVARGNSGEIEKVLDSFKPLFVDKAPLSLEDIFISEMEEKGYDFRTILV